MRRFQLVALTATLTAALAAAFPTGAHARIEHTGAPDASPAKLTTPGVAVATATALQSIVPEDFSLLIHRRAELPATLNWKQGEPWPQALAAIAKQHRLVAKIDWSEKRVFINPAPAVEPEPLRIEPVALAAPAAAPVQPDKPAAAKPDAPQKDPAPAERATSELPPPLQTAETAPPAPPLAQPHPERLMQEAKRELARQEPVGVTPKGKPAKADPIERSTSRFDPALRARAAAAVPPVRATHAATGASRLLPERAILDRVPAQRLTDKPRLAQGPGPLLEPNVAAAQSKVPDAPKVPVDTPKAAPLEAAPVALERAPQALPPRVDPRLKALEGTTPVPAVEPLANRSYGRGHLVDAVVDLLDTHGYFLAQPVPDIQLSAPLTAMRVDAGEDFRLLHRMLGANYSVDLWRSSSVVRITAASPGAGKFTVHSEPYYGPIVREMTRKAMSAPAAPRAAAAAAAPPTMPEGPASAPPALAAQPAVPEVKPAVTASPASTPVENWQAPPAANSAPPALVTAPVAAAPAVASPVVVAPVESHLHRPEKAASEPPSAKAASVPQPKAEEPVAPVAAAKSVERDEATAKPQAGAAPVKPEAVPAQVEPVASAKAQDSLEPVLKPEPKVELKVEPKPYALRVAVGQSLQDGLHAMLKEHGWSLRWEHRNDLTAGFPLSLDGSGVRDVLSKVLPRLGLNAEIYSDSKLVVVREPATSQ